MAHVGRQRTFELVPNAPPGPQQVGNDPSAIFSKPPMTTKQAKKLHNQKKGPKLSKTELRRIELMEQDRIRKEFEREKAQARARAARDKKKAKEDKEKEERKRKGLPLKDIHPSQDTISRFLSRAGMVATGKGQDSTTLNAHLATVNEEHSETATEAGDSETDVGDEWDDDCDKENQAPVQDDLEPERNSKRIRLEPPMDKEADRRGPAASQSLANTVARIVQQSQEEAFSRARSVDTDDPINETLLENQLMEDLKQASSKISSSREADNAQLLMPNHVSQPFTPADPVDTVSSAPKQPSQPRPSLSTLQPPQRTTVSVTMEVLPLENCSPHRVPYHQGVLASRQPNTPYVRPRPIVQPSAFRAPNGPPKFKTPAARPDHFSERPRFLPNHLTSAQHHRPLSSHQGPKQSDSFICLPKSTQAFIFDHADELFPTATQEARELAGDSLPDPPQPAAVRPKLSVNGPLNHPRHEPRPAAPEPVAVAAGISIDSPYLSTQDLILSTQDILDIDTPSKVASVSPARGSSLTLNVKSGASELSRAEREESTLPTSRRSAVIMLTEDPPRLERQIPVNRVSDAIEAAREAAGVVWGPCGSCTSTCHSHSHRSSFPSAHKGPHHNTKGCQQDVAGAAGSRTLQSLTQQHAAMAQQRSTLVSIEDSRSAAQASESVATSKNAPSKKRMFGSSGPGPEGLVAMERSYQEMLREKRMHKEQVRVQDRLLYTTSCTEQRLDLDLTEFADDFVDDYDDMNFEQPVCEGDTIDMKDTCPTDGQAPQPQTSAGSRAAEQLLVDTCGKAHQVASQETDYGDLDDDDFDFLEGDTAWLDENLDDV